jgi:hypothetical protein
MIKDRDTVSKYNLTITDPYKQAQFHGEFITDNVPICGPDSPLSGQIDQEAIKGKKPTDQISERIFY